MDQDKKKKLDDFKQRKTNCEILLKDYLSSKSHSYPTTRRQFLEAGLIGFAASLTLPSLLPSLWTRAHAQSLSCNQGAASGDLPGFMTIALAGGAGLMGQVQYSELDGTPLASYRTHGVGANPQTEELMGAPFYQRSSFAQGLKALLEEKGGMAVLAKTQLLATPCNNRDDTNQNEQDISGLILQLGKTGKFLQNTGTDGNTPGRLRNVPVMTSPPVAMNVRRVQDLLSAVQLSGQLGQLSKEQSTKLARFVSRLSEVQTRRLAMEASNGSSLKKVLDCATGENLKLIQTGVTGLDPTEDQALSTIWDINAGNVGNSFNNGDAENVGSRVVTAALAQATLLGNAGPVGAVLGGFDYHRGRTRAQADQKDVQLGRMIGRILLTAELRQKKMAIYVPTDGAVVSPNADNSDGADWTGDNSSRGSYWLILFDPAGRPSLAGNPNGGPNWQIGGYSQSQTVDRSFFTGGSSTLAAAALAVNYGLFAGKSSDLSKVFGGSFSAAQLKMISRVL